MNSTLAHDDGDSHTLCLGPDGCGGEFPLKKHPGLCARCAIVKQHEDEGHPQKANDIMALIHCKSCGTYGKLFDKETKLCGRCANLSAPKLAQPTASNATENAAVTPEMAAFNELQRKIEEVGKMMDAARGDAFQARMSQPPSAAHTSKRTVPPGPRTGNRDPSKAITAASSNPERTITVSIEARVKKELLGILGRTQRSYPADKEMDVIVEECLAQWNSAFWDSRAKFSLAREDVALRWAGNITPELDSEHKTLGVFYDTHWLLPHRETFFGDRPKTMKSFKGECIFLEILIDVTAFEERTSSPAPAQVQGSKGRGRPPTKHGRVDESSVADKNTTKRPRTELRGPRGTVLPSTFRPALAAGTSAASNNTPPLQTVNLKLALTSFDEDQKFLVAWDMNDGAQHCRASLATAERWNGKTKKVYHVNVDYGDGKPARPYVAKRFFQIGNGEGNVSCKENSEALTCDAQRLALAEMCLKEFYSLADQYGVEVAHDFEVTQWLLAKEELEDGDGTPSSASGISGEAWKTGSVADWDAGIVWLLEPRRSSIVQKWSGTMVHPNRSDKLHMTMSAFAHFSLLWSQYTLVFADIQSSYGEREGQKAVGKILFDIMTHTRSGESGVGDHGVEGLRKFATDHICNEVCEGLGLEYVISAHVDKAGHSDDGKDKGKGKEKEVATGGLGGLDYQSESDESQADD